MPLDASPLADFSHQVYEDLPDWMLEAMTVPGVENIICDPGGETFMHKEGEFASIGYFPAEAATKFMRKVAESIGRYHGQKHPILRAILPRRERLEAVHPRISPDGTAFVLRIPGPFLSLADMEAKNTISPAQRAFLEDIAGERNIVVAGEAGVGKTTLLRAIAASPKARAKRQISIEADPEVEKPRYGVRLIDIEPEPDEPVIPFMRLLRAALRLLPQLVIVSEVMTAEHAQALVHAAMGHKGMSTLHAASPEIAPRRLRELGKEVGGFPSADVARACAVVVQLEVDNRGKRRVGSICNIGVDRHEGFVAKLAA